MGYMLLETPILKSHFRPTQLPHRQYTGSAPALHWLCTSPTLVLHQSYTGSAPVLHWPCTSHKLALHQSCTGICYKDSGCTSQCCAYRTMLHRRSTNQCCAYRTMVHRKETAAGARWHRSSKTSNNNTSVIQQLYSYG